jgi:hypothetical protein
MDRRTFNKVLTTGAMGLAVPRSFVRAQQSASAGGTAPPTQWPGQVYRRLLVDNHVPDWDPVFLSRFDPVDYVGTIAGAGFQALMQYAIGDAGLCLWRTKIGQMHGGMRGRDYFGEVMDQCKRRGLHRTALFLSIWDNHAYEHHPDWRFQPEEGEDRIMQGRYGYTCPNTPYRDYALALVRELVSNYDFEGIFNDMIIWPGVCYCPYCTARYWKEYNTEPPRIVDWDDPEWRRFQAGRQRWLFEFADEFTKTAKSVRPIHVEHQFATVFHDWRAGVSLRIGTEASDSVGGDFYGGLTQFSLACKAFNGLNRVRPFEFMTSATNNITDFVTMKPLDELRAESLLPTIHSAALLTIDACNPDGTINHNVYELLGKINRERAPYEPFLGGSLMADVAIYYDKESMYDPDEKGVHVVSLFFPELKAPKSPHFDGVSGAARILREGHIPFSVITNATLEQLKDYRAVIVPNVLELTAEQAAQFRSFVDQGGVLYASGPSSLDRFNKTGPRYLLEDVLGMHYKGKLGTQVTYLTPKDDELKKIIWPQNEIIHNGPMIQAEASPGAEVLGTVTLPYVDPETIHVIGSHFAQQICDPPAPTAGTDPGLVINSFGRGKAVWVAAPIEASPHAVNARLILSLLHRVLPRPYHFEVEAHPSVEMTLYHQPENQRLLAGLLNMQQQLPPIPLGATVQVQVPSGRRATRVVRVPDRETIPFEKAGPYVKFRIEPFEVLAMAIVEYH